MDGAPVLAITGQTYHDLLGTHYQQEVDLQEQKLAEDEPSDKRVPGHTSAIWTPPYRVPTQELLGRAAELLSHGKKTVILAGRGALGAGEELEAIADQLAAPIVKALLGKAVVPDDSPFTTGGIGLIGTRPSEMAMEECDTLLMVGTNFPYLEFVPRPGQARAARGIRIRRSQQFSCSGNLATMGPGLPYAIAAQAAYPGRQCVAFVGDGGFTMLMGEFATAVKYRLPIRVIVIKNNSLGQIKWEQMVFLGNPEYGCELQPIDFVKFAEACGGAGFRCERPEEVKKALSAAFRVDGPALVEAVVDPFEPPMPSMLKPKQALHMAESLARGQPNRARIALTLFRSKIRDLF
jgi:thiamine pyrophosphate-dependent acetolactate synthase large subunit-like protein